MLGSPHAATPAGNEIGIWPLSAPSRMLIRPANRPRDAAASRHLRALRRRHGDLVRVRGADRGRDGRADRAADGDPRVARCRGRRRGPRVRVRMPAPGARRLPVGDRGQRVHRPATPAPWRRPSAVRGAVRAARRAGVPARARAASRCRTTPSVALHEACGFMPVGVYRGSASSRTRGGTSGGGSCEPRRRARGTA